MEKKQSRMILSLLIDGEWHKCRAMHPQEKLDEGDVKRSPHRGDEYVKMKGAPDKHQVDDQDFAKGRYFKILGKIAV